MQGHHTTLTFEEQLALRQSRLETQFDNQLAQEQQQQLAKHGKENEHLPIFAKKTQSLGPKEHSYKYECQYTGEFDSLKNFRGQQHKAKHKNKTDHHRCALKKMLDLIKHICEIE